MLRIAMQIVSGGIRRLFAGDAGEFHLDSESCVEQLHTRLLVLLGAYARTNPPRRAGVDSTRAASGEIIKVP